MIFVQQPSTSIRGDIQHSVCTNFQVVSSSRIPDSQRFKLSLSVFFSLWTRNRRQTSRPLVPWSSPLGGNFNLKTHEGQVSQDRNRRRSLSLRRYKYPKISHHQVLHHQCSKELEQKLAPRMVQVEISQFSVSVGKKDPGRFLGFSKIIPLPSFRRTGTQVGPNSSSKNSTTPVDPGEISDDSS